MKTHFYLVLLFFNLGLYAQSPPPNFTDCGTPTQDNLVINGGFEENNENIPDNLSQLILACKWIDNVSDGSPDYFHTDSPLNDGDGFSIPDNTFGYQNVNPDFGGHAYAGFGVSPALTEIIATQLTTPLQPNRNYILSFDVSMADYTEEIPEATSNPIKLQAFLSTEFISNSNSGELNTSNGILEQYDTFSSNTTGWDRISLGFSTDSNAGQQYLYIGGISNIVFQDPNATGIPTYYYIDNVSLEEGNIECIAESIVVTCTNSDSNTSTVCGNFTTAYPEDYQLTITGHTGIFQNQFTLNHEDFTIPEEDIQINTDGTITGSYCIEFTNQGNLDYNFKVTLSSNSDICSISTPFTSLFNLDLCPQEPDPCEDENMNITNLNQLPSCLELNEVWEEDINVSINLPSDWGLNEIQQNWLDENGDPNFYLNIIDENNPSNPFNTETFFYDYGVSNGIFTYTYRLNRAGNMSNMTDTTYRFEVVANLGECELSQEFTIDTCEDTVDPCEFLGIGWDYLDNAPDCNIFDNGDSYQICGTFSALDGIGYNMYLSIESNNNPSDNFNIPITPDPNSISITDGVVIGSYCIDLLESDFDLSDDSYTISKHISYNDTSILCNAQPVNYPIPLDDCVESTECQDNPVLENLLATHLKNILNAILDLDNGFTGMCGASQPTTAIDITNMPEVIQFMQEYNFQERLQNAMDIRELENNISGYTANITHVYYIWTYDYSQGESCLSIQFRNHNIYYSNGLYFRYKFSDELDPTLIQEFTNIEIDIEHYKATYNYIGVDGQTHSLYDTLLPQTRTYSSTSGLAFCWFHDLDYTPPVANNSINLYPNPTSDYTTISSEKFDIKTIQVYDINGNLIDVINDINKTKYELKVSKLKKGYYIIKVTLSDGSIINENLLIQ